jgi:hypothetical protein
MIEQSRQTIQFTVGFLIGPALELDEQRVAAFRARLEEEDIRFEHAEHADSTLVLARTAPSSLQVQIVSGQVGAAAEPVPVTQIVIATVIAQDVPVAAMAEFADAAHEVTDVVRDLWPEMEYVLGWNTGVRSLFASSTEHSFQYLWEQRLRQDTQELSVFGRPILGGGLRLMFPPGQDEGEHFQAEVRVESFLEDVRRLYVELNLANGNPEPINALNPTVLIQATEAFMDERVLPFLLGGEQPANG